MIRDAVEADLPAIVEIYNATVRTRMVTAELEPTTVEARLPWFREHSPDRYPLWVAESDGHLIGWLDFKKFLPRAAYDCTAEISVYVDEKFRRRGVGQLLLERAISRARPMGITALVGLIFGHNEPSLKLFGRLGFERWGFLPDIARLDGVQRNLVIVGRHCKAVSYHRALRARGYNECLNLMHTLMAYRHEPIHSQLMKVRDNYSMLHLDVLLLIYHFAKICSGAVLEIGAFVGGATIAAAFGVRDSGKQKTLITVEAGGSVKHKRLGTRNILRDLERNLNRERVAKLVTVVPGQSFKPQTVAVVREMLGADQLGLLILDADAAKRRDIDCYHDKLIDGAWMVIDDYYGADANEKITPSRADVDALVGDGVLAPLGFYGWSTFVGRWRGGARH